MRPEPGICLSREEPSNGAVRSTDGQVCSGEPDWLDGRKVRVGLERGSNTALKNYSKEPQTLGQGP